MPAHALTELIRKITPGTYHQLKEHLFRSLCEQTDLDRAKLHHQSWRAQSPTPRRSIPPRPQRPAPAVLQSVVAAQAQRSLFPILTVSVISSFSGLHTSWAIAIYNISPFYPLAKFPGPKLAAVGYLYEAYYDFILIGRYIREIQKMHEKYGKQFPDLYS